MSKIGKQVIQIDSSIKASYENNCLKIQGAYGELQTTVDNCIQLEITDNHIKVYPSKVSKKSKELWGLTRALLNNMVIGVTKKFQKKLEIHGVGYKASLIDQSMLRLSLGFSHDVIYCIPKFIVVNCPTMHSIEITGCDKQLVGQVAADIRSIRKPEPYKGKGIRYEGEHITIKEAKKK